MPQAGGYYPGSAGGSGAGFDPAQYNQLGSGMMGYQSSLDAMHSLFNPQIKQINAGANQQVDALQNQINQYGQNTQYQQGIVNSDLQYQMGQYGLQHTGLDQGNAYNQQQYGLQQQGFGLQQAGINEQYRIDPLQYGLQTAGFDLQQQGLEAQMGNLGYQYGQQQKSAQQGAAGAGVFSTQGFRDTMGNLKQGYEYSAGNIDRSQQQLGLNRQGADLSHQEHLFGLGQQQQQLGLSEQGAANTNQYQQQQYQNAIKGLGMSEDQARTKAQQAITQLGLTNQLNVDQLLQQIGQTRSGQASQLSGIMPQLMQLMGA